MLRQIPIYIAMLALLVVIGATVALQFVQNETSEPPEIMGTEAYTPPLAESTQSTPMDNAESDASNGQVEPVSEPAAATYSLVVLEALDFESLEATEYPAVFDSAMVVGDASARDQVMNRLFVAWSLKAPAAAAAFAARIADDEVRIRQLKKISNQWPVFDAPAAADWLNALEEPEGPAWEQFISDVYSRLLTQRPDTADTYASGLPSARYRKLAGEIMTYRKLGTSTIDEIDAWLAGIANEDVAFGAYRAAASDLLQASTPRTLGWISGMDGDSIGMIAALDAVIAHYQDDSPRRAATWIATLAAGDARDAGLEQAVKAWGIHLIEETGNADMVAAWAGSLLDTELKSAAARGYRAALDETGQDD